MKPLFPLCLALVLATPALAQEQRAFDCVIEPANIVSVTSSEAGLLAEVPFRRGDTVAKGDVVARLDNRVEKTTIALLEERAVNGAEIAAQEARLNLSESQRDRIRTLVDREIGAAGDLEAAEAAVEVAIGELDMARMRQRVAELELQRALETLERRTIRSPVDGIVVQTLLSPGEYADQDNPVLEVAELDPLHVEAFLPLDLYAQIALGDTAVVRPAEPVGGTYSGEVSVIDQVFDAASGTFGVRVDLENPDLTLPAGLRCTVSF